MYYIAYAFHRTPVYDDFKADLKWKSFIFALLFGRPSHFCSHLRSSCISGLRDPPPLVKSINSEMAAIWAALMCCQSVSLPVCQCVSKCAIIKWSGQMQLWSITPYISPEEGEGSTVYANFIIALKLPVTSAQTAQLSPSLSLSLPLPFPSLSDFPLFLVTSDFYLTEMGSLYCFLLGTFTGSSVSNPNEVAVAT